MSVDLAIHTLMDYRDKSLGSLENSLRAILACRMFASEHLIQLCEVLYKYPTEIFISDVALFTNLLLKECRAVRHVPVKYVPVLFMVNVARWIWVAANSRETIAAANTRYDDLAKQHAYIALSLARKDPTGCRKILKRSTPMTYIESNTYPHFDLTFEAAVDRYVTIENKPDPLVIFLIAALHVVLDLPIKHANLESAAWHSSFMTPRLERPIPEDPMAKRLWYIEQVNLIMDKTYKEWMVAAARGCNACGRCVGQGEEKKISVCGACGTLRESYWSVETQPAQSNVFHWFSLSVLFIRRKRNYVTD